MKRGNLRTLFCSPRIPKLLLELKATLAAGVMPGGEVRFITPGDGGLVETPIPLPMPYETPGSMAAEKGARLAVAQEGPGRVIVLENRSHLQNDAPCSQGPGTFAGQSFSLTGIYRDWGTPVGEMAWGKQGLWAVDPVGACLRRLDPGQTSDPWRIVPVGTNSGPTPWRLTGMAMAGGAPRYITAFREEAGGIIVDLVMGEAVVRGMGHPCAPRLIGGNLYFMDRSTGEIKVAETDSGRVETVIRLSDPLAGMARLGDYLFAGVGCNRGTGLPGVAVVGVSTGRVHGTIWWEDRAVQRITAVAVLPDGFWIESGSGLSRTAPRPDPGSGIPGKTGSHSFIKRAARGATAVMLSGTLLFSYPHPARAYVPTFAEQPNTTNPLKNPVDVVQYSAPAFVDVDGDGDSDAFIGAGDGTITYYENTGSENTPAFEEKTGADNPLNGVDVGEVSAPAFVDVNGDGLFDAFIGALDGTITYYENTGSGNSPAFVEKTGTDNPLNGVDVGENSAPTFVDVDGDGDFDAFIGDFNGTVHYYKNTGSSDSPDFDEQTGTDNPLNGVDVGRDSAPAFVDVDGDGDYDAFIGALSGTINYYENTGSRSCPAFMEKTGAANPFKNPVDVGRDSAPAFVDVDGDGDYDAFIGEGDGNINYYENTGTSTSPAFERKTGTDNLFGGVFVGQRTKPAFVDVDGDGDYDAFIGEQDGTINYCENTGTGTSPAFERKTGTDNPLNGVDVVRDSAPAFVDVDGDGDFDAFIGELDGNINYYENTGSSDSPAFVERTGTDNPLNGVDVGHNSAPTFVDVDGDGDYDAFIGEGDGNINYYENTGTGTSPVFERKTGTDNPLNGVDVGDLSAPAFVDVDGDGDSDAFIGEEDSAITYYKNTGICPAFSEKTGMANPFGGVDVGEYSAPAFVDVDGDGDFDAFIGEWEGTVCYYENTGTSKSPAFVERTGTENPLNGVDMGDRSKPTFVDINGDGLSDGFMGEATGVLQYYKNTSDPTLVELSSFSAVMEEGRIILTWETASELDTAGFHIWRSNNPDRGYERITPSLIPSEGGPVFGASYTYEDHDVTPPRTFYYKLEEIDDSGAGTFYGPVLCVFEGAAGTCPECPEEPCLIKDVTFVSGKTYDCAYDRSVIIGSGVTVQKDANVTLRAPEIKFRSGFRAEPGAVVETGTFLTY